MGVPLVKRVSEMDLRAYYRKIREAESTIDEEFPVVRSLATEEGGKDGHLTEVSRATAARMLTDGMVELATSEETRAFWARIKEARKLEQERQRASQIQFTVLSEADVRTLQRSGRATRKEG